MALVFWIFFVVAVLSRFAKTEELDCPVYRVSTRSAKTHWGPKNIYSTRICFKTGWPIETCSRAKESFVALNIKHGSGTEVLKTNFMPAEVKGGFCAIFDACRIAKALKGKDLTEASVTVTIEMFAFKKVLPDQKPLSLYGANEVLNWHYFGAKSLVEHDLLSVICLLPNCTIQSEGYGGDAKYYFTEGEKNRAPTCLEEGGRTTPGAFSVTQFVCDPKCTRTYTYVSSPFDFPPRPKECRR